MPTYHVDVTGRSIQLPPAPPAAATPLWFEIRPNLKRSAVLSSDILAALGKRRDVAGKGRNENQDVALALAWLHAYEITAIVALESQRLTGPSLRHLVVLAKTAGLPLWLLHRRPSSDDFELLLKRVNAHPMRPGDIPTPVADTAQDGHRPTLGVPLADAGFGQFRDAQRRTLTPSQNGRVERWIQTVLDDAEEYLSKEGPTVEAVADLVEQSLIPAPMDDQLTADLRAIQIAAWHHDLYLKVDVSALLNSAERPTLDPVTADRLLTAYREPHRALAVGLTSHQVGVAAMRQITLRDVTADGDILLGGRAIRLEEHTRRAALAQRKLRVMNGASDDDVLLRVTERALSSALNKAALDFGIRVHGRRAERHLHPGRWLARLGIATHSLS